MPTPLGSVAHNRKEMTGFKNEMLEVLEYWDTHSRKSRWLCLCLCGNLTIQYGDTIRRRVNNGCGCQKRFNSTTHGMSKTPTWKSWRAMRQRMTGARWAKWYSDLSICERWNNFENFLLDMGERPKGMTLDRINPNGNYEPSNCRWATWKQQANNRRAKAALEVK